MEAEVGVGEVGEVGPGRGRGRGGCLPSRLEGCVTGAVRGADLQPTGWVLGVVQRAVPLLVTSREVSSPSERVFCLFRVSDCAVPVFTRRDDPKGNIHLQENE